MPTYDYVCPDCDEIIEFKHGVHDILTYRHCQTPMRKKYHGTAIHFKGGGWASKS